jgi:predicted transcriptional regulator of viral defense system
MRMSEEAGRQRERALVRAAARRHWVVTTADLAALGFSRNAIQHRRSSGRLFRVHRGVYAVGRRALTPAGSRLAAVLAAGHGAALSHTSAAAQWQLVATAQTLIDVTVATGRRPRRGIRLHVTTTLAADDVTEIDGIPITSVARTLVDLAARVRRRRLLEAIEQAYTLRHLDVGELRQALRRNHNHRGVGTLAELLDGFAEPPSTRSQLERMMLHVIVAAGLPEPLVNALVAGLCVDLLWPAWRLVVELDGRRFHDNPWAFERDRRRDAILRTAGYEILRVSHRRLTREPDAVIADIRALAALRDRSAS